MVMNFVERHEKALSAGVDWVTCSREDVRPGDPFDEVATALLHASLEDGESVKLATWMGYAGLRSATAFYGWHGCRAVAWLSGPHNAALTAELIKAASNVSRIDLQLTVEHTPADPAIGRRNYRLAAEYDGRPGARPIVQEIHDTRSAWTTAVGSRISDQYGRCYDKGIESKLAPAGTIWRYEVEYKRGMAKKVAQQIALSGKAASDAARSVWRWWATRGVLATAREPRGSLIDLALPGRSRPDYLSYFETKVSRSVRRAIESHGLHPVVRALGLLPYIDESEDGTNA